MLNLEAVTTIEQSMYDYFNDYPCEWIENNEGLWDWSLHYKTGSLIGWIESPDPDSEFQQFTATFSPQGWKETPNEKYQSETLTDAELWLQARFLDFLYPDGWQFSGAS